MNSAASELRLPFKMRCDKLHQNVSQFPPVDCCCKEIWVHGALVKKKKIVCTCAWFHMCACRPALYLMREKHKTGCTKMQDSSTSPTFVHNQHTFTCPLKGSTSTLLFFTQKTAFQHTQKAHLEWTLAQKVTYIHNMYIYSETMSQNTAHSPVPCTALL